MSFTLHETARQVHRFAETLSDSWEQARELRGRKLARRRVSSLDPRLMRDIGLEGAPLAIVPAAARCGGDALSEHALSPGEWPVTGANDNIGWQPKRAWLALF